MIVEVENKETYTGDEVVAIIEFVIQKDREGVSVNYFVLFACGMGLGMILHAIAIRAGLLICPLG